MYGGLGMSAPPSLHRESTDIERLLSFRCTHTVGPAPTVQGLFMTLCYYLGKPNNSMMVSDMSFQ